MNMFSHKKFKASVKSWISFQKVYGAIKFNPKICLKSYIEMNTELRKKNRFRKRFFSVDEQFSFRRHHGKCKKT